MRHKLNPGTYNSGPLLGGVFSGESIVLLRSVNINCFPDSNGILSWRWACTINSVTSFRDSYSPATQSS